MKENLAETLHNNGMLYFVIGSLISSDSILSKEDAEKALTTLSSIEKDIKMSSLDNEIKTDYLEKLQKCYEVLNSDIERL